MYESSTCNLVLDANCFYMTLKSFQMFIPCIACVTQPKIKKNIFWIAKFIFMGETLIASMTEF